MFENTTLYGDSLAYINAVCESYVGENAAAVARVVGPFLFTMMALYVALWGLASFRGAINEPFNEFIGRMLKLTAILAIGFNMANYNILITNTFLHGPDEFIAGMSRNPNAGSVISGLDAMLGDGVKIAGRFWTKAGILNGDPGMYIIAAMVFAVTLAVTAYAFALMALAKVMLTAVIAVGPLFFIGLLFEATAGFFNSWLRQLANYFAVPVLVVMVNLLVLTLFARAASGTTAMTSSAEVSELVPFFATSIVCLMALASVLSVASGLAGGVSLSSFGIGRLAGKFVLRTSVKTGEALTRQGGRSVMWAGRKVARGAWSVYQNRNRNSVRPTKAKP
jgi:type IV secretion system protein VirB6